MKWLVLVLLVLLGFLQYRLWVGEGSLAQVANLKRDIERQQQENAHLRARNQALAQEIEALKSGSSIEDRARRDMGMIRKDETFVLLVDEEEAKRAANANPPPAVNEVPTVNPADVAAHKPAPKGAGARKGETSGKSSAKSLAAGKSVDEATPQQAAEPD